MKKILILCISTFISSCITAVPDNAIEKIFTRIGINLNDFSSKGRAALKALPSNATPLQILRVASAQGNMYGEDLWRIDPRGWWYGKTTQQKRENLKTALTQAEEEDKKTVKPSEHGNHNAPDGTKPEQQQSLYAKTAHYAGITIAIISIARLLYYTTRSTRKRAIARFALKKFFSNEFAYQVSLMSPMDQMVIERAQRRILWCIAGMITGGGAILAGRYVL